MKGRKVEHTSADIAADARVASGLFQDMPDQRGRGRLAIGTGDADDFRAAAFRQ